MAIFGREKSPEPAPTPTPSAPDDTKAPAAPAEDPRFVQLQDGLNRLTDTVSRFVESTNAPRPGPAPVAPAIADISDEAYDAALEEGGAAARKAILVRQGADTERLRRQFADQLAQVQGPGMAAINDLTVRSVLRDDEFYKNDAAIKKDVDGQVALLKNQGVLVTEEALRWVLGKVKSDHMDRILKDRQEQFVRQQREEVATPERGRKSGREVAQERKDGVPSPSDLTPDAEKLLASRNHGRGMTEDDFARSLPQRQIVNKEGKRERFKYDSWDDMMTKYDEAQKEYEEQLEHCYGRR